MALPVIDCWIVAAVSVFGEAFVLGLASGPACIASCGPVLVPSLLAERSGLKLNSRYLALFLAARLAGYLLFAATAWAAGALLTFAAPKRAFLFALIHILLACVLLRFAHAVGRACAHGPAATQLVTIGAPRNHAIPGAAVLGFLTGVSLCPPFVAAGVRAAEMASVAAALLFFGVFFVGTTVWFVPLAGMGWIKRNEAVITVARMAMVLIALYYLVIGLSTLIGIRYGY